MSKNITRLCLATVLLAFAVVVLGAFTRLVDAGLGCPDWPTCYGHLWVPNSAEEVHVANQNFSDTPVEHGKTWPEQAHRIIASSLGSLILMLFFLCYRARPDQLGRRSVAALLAVLVGGTVARIFIGDAMDPYLWLFVVLYFLNLCRLLSYDSAGVSPFKLPALLAGLVVLQGLFGMWTVTLNLWPKVVTLHLLGGFATLTLLILLYQRLADWHWQANASVVVQFMKLRPLAVVAVVVVSFQIALGGWVSSNYAALACPDFPLCQNEVIPPTNFRDGFNVFQEIGPNYLGGRLDNHARTAIHFTHRLGALVVLVVLGVFAWRLYATGSRQARNFTVVLLSLLFVQLLLGIMNVVLSLPLSIAVAHNAVGALLLIVVVSINHRIRTVKTL